ncbi:MAG: hypothetical protein PUP46_07075 [Endozoicomonas sp. (ex Botrylloides leachii)]|nr:hypothetical protein [Endozoicomonas sp. (ex Botrylloides leachii)]
MLVSIIVTLKESLTMEKQSVDISAIYAGSGEIGQPSAPENW